MGQRKVNLFGSGAILREALRAAEILEERYQVSADVWSATSYGLLHRNCLDVERWNRLHPTEQPRKAYLTSVLEHETGPIVAASDYLKLVPDQLARWIPQGLVSLGTDGFGRSEDRASLRQHFEVNAEHIVVAALDTLSKQGQVDKKTVQQAITDMGIQPDTIDPRYA